MYLYIASNIQQNYFINRISQELRDNQRLIVFNPYATDIPSGELVLWRTTGINYNDSDLEKFHKYKVINPTDTLMLLRDKLKTYSALKNKLPLNSTIYLGEFLNNPHEIHMNSLIKNKSVVVKTIRGNQGRGVFEVEDENWWQAFLKNCENLNDYKYLLQPKLQGIEYRLFLLKSNKPIVLQRISNGFKANFHQAGSAKLIETFEFNELAKLLKKHLDFTYLAVDLIVKNDSPIIIDINGVPGIEQLELVSRQNIARKILDLII